MGIGVKKTLLTLFAIKLFISAVLGIYTYNHVFIEEQVTRRALLIIEKGMSANEIGDLLVENKVLQHKIVFYLVVKYYAMQHQYIKAGEYEFTPGMHFLDVLHKLLKGEVVKHYLTIPEGHTNHQIFITVDKAYGLMGNINSKQYKEGELLPQTYQYRYGDTKNSILAHMHRNMQQTLKEALHSKALPHPLRDAKQLIILASIVELETPLKVEKPKVARVYLNRLIKGMPLQADPTVIYAITNGEENWNKSVTYKDLEFNSPFNTYRHLGLPPTAIANPGVDAINASITPADSDDLYFVADGKGGHLFAQTYEQHMYNVRAYRAFKKNNSAKN